MICKIQLHQKFFYSLNYTVSVNCAVKFYGVEYWKDLPMGSVVWPIEINPLSLMEKGRVFMIKNNQPPTQHFCSISVAEDTKSF